MKIKLKKIYAISFTLILITIIIFAGTQNEKELEINYIYVSYIYDQNNPYEVVGYADYVFVAKVNEKKDTLYTNVQKINLFKKFGLPYTQYSITIVDNIKGYLEVDVPIIYQQFGGISINNKSLDLVKDDELLEPGSYYIIVAASNADGSILSVAPIGHKKLDVKNEEEIQTSKEYNEFVDYYENEVLFKRERFNSEYTD